MSAVALDPTFFYRLSQGTCRAAARALRGLSVSGLERVPERGPVIVAANHVSLMDPPLVAIALYPRRLPHFMAKEELFRLPVFGSMIRGYGAIPLDRGRGDVGAIRRSLDVLEEGGCMVVFPEGTRSRDGRPGRPKAGVGLLARDGRAPVVPARVRGTDRLLSGGPFEVRFGDAIDFSGGEDRGACQSFAEKVMDAVFKL